MASELDTARRVVVAALRRLDAVPVENPVAPGTPDVNYIGGWIELKHVDRWPVRGGALRVPHYTPQQRAWARKRAYHGGLVWMLLKVGRYEWLLIPGERAADELDYVAKDRLIAIAVKYWDDGLDEAELLDFLVKANNGGCYA